MNGAPPDRLVRLPEVLRRVGVSKSTLHRMIRQGAFPGGHRVSYRVTVWSEIRIVAWMERILDGRTCHLVPDPAENGGMP